MYTGFLNVNRGVTLWWQRLVWKILYGKIFACTPLIDLLSVAREHVFASVLFSSVPADV